MKENKKMLSALALLLGAVVLTTSALADVLLGSGYLGLKNAAKVTMNKLANETASFMVEMSGSFEIDGVVIKEASSIDKFDMINNAKEIINTDSSTGKTYYNYSDSEISISRYGDTDTYHVYERALHGDEEYTIFENPFEEDEAKDAERIVDAFVGSLSDIVQVFESDGKKMYTGNLSEAQIPPLLNAVVSYFVKYGVITNYQHEAENQLGFTLPKNEIYLLSASGRAIENENGMLEAIVGNISLSGKGEDNSEHTYYAEFSVELKDVNSTSVTRPNLEGADVRYHTNGEVLDKKFVGKYKNDIVKEEGDRFVKLGERYVEITSIEGDKVSGRYYEVDLDGNVDKEIEFIATPRRKFGQLVMDYTDKNGEKKNGIIGSNGHQNIYVTLDVEVLESGYRTINAVETFDSSFIRVFE